VENGKLAADRLADKKLFQSANLEAFSSAGILPAMRARRSADSRRDGGATGGAGDERRRCFPWLAS